MPAFQRADSARWRRDPSGGRLLCYVPTASATLQRERQASTWGAAADSRVKPRPEALGVSHEGDFALHGVGPDAVPIVAGDHPGRLLSRNAIAVSRDRRPREPDRRFGALRTTPVAGVPGPRSD